MKTVVDVMGYGLVPETQKEAPARELVRVNELTAGAA